MKLVSIHMGNPVSIIGEKEEILKSGHSVQSLRMLRYISAVNIELIGLQRTRSIIFGNLQNILKGIQKQREM